MVTPRSHKLRVEERDGSISLVDDRVEHVIGLAIENDGRAGIRLDVNLVKLRFPTMKQRGQFVSG